MPECSFREQIDKAIIGGDAKALVDTAQKIAKKMITFKYGKFEVDKNNSVSSSQVRNIFGTTKKVELILTKDNASELYSKLLLLKPKLAYINGRHNKTGKKDSFNTFVTCLSYSIDIIDSDYIRMNNFFNFFEAILAYHKAEGGD